MALSSRILEMNGKQLVVEEKNREWAGVFICDSPYCGTHDMGSICFGGTLLIGGMCSFWIASSLFMVTMSMLLAKKEKHKT